MVRWLSFMDFRVEGQYLLFVPLSDSLAAGQWWRLKPGEKNSDANDAAIVRTIIAMSRSLGLEVIAEGVETSEQEAYVIGEGCHEGQGYLYSKPLGARELLAYLKQAKRRKTVIM